jgi:nucleotide-binding universal stress UspA family protein
MVPFKKILWPTDFSEPSLEALKAAQELAAAFCSELYALHVIPPIPVAAGPDGSTGFNVSLYEADLDKSAKRSLADIRDKKIAKDLKVHQIISHGHPAYEIPRIAEQKRVDLIVMATHGETGWKHFIFGSVAEKVMRHVSCPVLTIHAPREIK